MRAALLALTVLFGGCHAKVEAKTPKVQGNHESVELAEGTYEGDLIVGGNHNTVTGAGYGKTIIKGKLLMSGNHNTVSSVTIEGGGTIEGNHNDATKAQFHGDVTTGGNKNQ